MLRNYSLPDYSEYRLKGKEGILYLLEGTAFVWVIGYFLYH